MAFLKVNKGQFYNLATLLFFFSRLLVFMRLLFFGLKCKLGEEGKQIVFMQPKKTKKKTTQRVIGTYWSLFSKVIFFLVSRSSIQCWVSSILFKPNWVKYKAFHEIKTSFKTKNYKFLGADQVKWSQSKYMYKILLLL